MELNPNHPVSQAIHNQWHKLAALLMVKLEADHVVITAGDIAKLSHGIGIQVEEKPDGLHISIIEMAKAVELAYREGGLPS
ncbi:MAG: hypothetical protein D3M94_07260 [Rhodocyclales bacterium GT-UBC]|nr:MAG: hypothetical protein D3M94_07260 [Rhodocyclales bacterium GT-UBC]